MAGNPLEPEPGIRSNSAMSDPGVHRIEVSTETFYIEAQSDPEADRYVFAYRITIRNVGRVAAQLLRRHWVITDSHGKVEEVRGDGVVGEQPHLGPGEMFRYTSGAVIETPGGHHARELSHGGRRRRRVRRRDSRVRAARSAHVALSF